MLAYIIRRFLIMIPTLLGVSIIVFLMLHLTPGDPAELLLGQKLLRNEKLSEQSVRPFGLRLSDYLCAVHPIHSNLNAVAVERKRLQYKKLAFHTPLDNQQLLGMP